MATDAASHPWSLAPRGDHDAAPPSPSSTPPPPPIDSSDRSPQKPPPEEVAPSPSDAARSKKPAWKRPPNGSIEAGGAAVMGGSASWPALSESAKAAVTSKPPSSDALKSLSEGPVPAPSGPVVSSSSPKPNLNPSSTPNHVAPARQKSMRRSGSSSGTSSSGGAPADGGMVQSSPPPASAPMTQALPEPSPRDQPSKNTANWDHASRGSGSGSQAHDGSDHHRGFGGNRRWNNGGDSGSHHNNYSNRHDGYRRNAGGRDVQMRNPRPYLRLPVSPVAPPFLSPRPHAQPFGNSMVFSGKS
ncbi:la-related protein 1B-like isoform X2 [Canna indica]|uniref:La-related protein 1B-like isoform X2 n=1 Tax=Canna indica TaxID=4628 RepID=A0AAQ3KLL5_9LILI|nr:la-related protein 1B-like isoform X2 [Canna indica]